MTYIPEQMRAHAATLHEWVSRHSGSDITTHYRLAAEMIAHGADAVEALAAKDAEIAELRASDREMKWERCLKNQQIAASLNFETYVSDIEKRDAEIAQLRHGSYPHMCRDGHVQIGHSDSGDDERCPLCRVNDAFAAERAKVRELREWLSRNEGNGKRTADELLLLLVVRGKLDALGLTGEEPR